MASVRYEGLIKYLKNKYKITVVNDNKYGSLKSKYVNKNFKFITSKKGVNEQLGSNNISNKKINKILRSKYILKGIRTILHGNLLFNINNRNLYMELESYINQEKIDAIFVTVPYIYNLYIIKKIKKKFPLIPVIVEVRDILAHNIGKGYPKYTYKKAETILHKFTDHIIVLSEGIYKHHRNRLNDSQNITIIKNGYEENDFLDCNYKPLIDYQHTLRFAHIGSIYEGRNLHDFLEALNLLQKQTNCKVILDIVGILDSQAKEELNLFLSIPNQMVKVNQIGTLPHREAIKYLKKCDIAVILTHITGSDYAIPGKTFEYIGACKPIIAVTNDKSLINIVHNKYGVCSKHNVNNIYSGIITLMNSNYSFEDRIKYSRQRQAEKISEIIDSYSKVKY